jgi:hypothetical protein
MRFVIAMSLFLSTSAFAQLCDQSKCEIVVCHSDPFCCEVEWDITCEYNAQSLCYCHSDVNFDNVVDGGDIAIVLDNWGRTWQNGGHIADINFDGIVGANDIISVLNSWGTCSAYRFSN